MNKNEQSIIALPDASLIILQVNKQLGIVKTILENERKNHLDKNKKSTFDLTSYADHYYSLGLNVTCISNERNQFNHLCKNLLKNPNHKYENYYEERQSKLEFSNLSWATCVGVGTVTNYDGLLVIDIDGCQDYSIVEQILDILEIEYNYEWIVESGSRKGFHIIIKSSRDYELKDSVVMTCKPNEKYNGKFEKIEFLWKTHIVLPPSLHISGNYYEFKSRNNPKSPPCNIKRFDLEKIINLFSDENVKYGSAYANTDDDIYLNSGNAKYNLKDYEGAILDYDKVIELSPDYADAFYNRGLAKYILKNYEDAIIDFTQAIQSNPNYTNAYNERGDAKYALEDYQGAILDYEKAIELNSDNENAYHNRGDAKYALEDYHGAILDYDKSIKLSPNNKDAYNNRGNVKFDLEDFKNAILDYNKAIELNDSEHIAYFLSGRAFLKMQMK